LENQQLWPYHTIWLQKSVHKAGAENAHHQTQNCPTRKTFVQNFSSTVRKTEMLLCQE